MEENEKIKKIPIMQIEDDDDESMERSTYKFIDRYEEASEDRLLYEIEEALPLDSWGGMIAALELSSTACYRYFATIGDNKADIEESVGNPGYFVARIFYGIARAFFVEPAEMQKVWYPAMAFLYKRLDVELDDFVPFLPQHMIILSPEERALRDLIKEN